MGEIPNYTLEAPPSLQLHTEHFNPTMLYYGIFVVGVAVFILSVYHCLVVKCCTDRPPWAGPFTGPGPSPEDRDKDHVEVVSATVKYRKGSGGGVEECVVCLSMFEEGEEVRELPRCKHSFHAPCIDKWLYYHFDCPLCRAPVAVDDHVGVSLSTISGPTV